MNCINILELVKTSIPALAASGGLLVGAIALANYRKSVRWKQAELANMQLRDLVTNEDLVFACRSIDWYGGLLVVPEALRPLLEEAGQSDVIEHSPSIVARAMAPDLSDEEMKSEPRLQLYRTAIDSLLSWFSLVQTSLHRKLYEPADIEAIAWWLFRIKQASYLEDFIQEFGYKEDVVALHKTFDLQIRKISQR